MISATEIRWRGRKLDYFAGCDYLGLSHDARLVRAVQEGAFEAGINAAASRKTTGNRPIYSRTEKQIANYFGVKKAILVSNGYLTNLTVAQGLQGKIERVLIDERSHASLQDALALLGAEVIRFQHLNVADLKSKLSKAILDERTALMTDGMFAHSGAVAPLKNYRHLLGAKVLMWVDDSHAAGAIGGKGGGTPDYFGLSRRSLVQTVTFSKAFGCYGGAILGSEKLGGEIFERSRIASGNTPLPPMLAAAILQSLKLAGKKLRDRLQANVTEFYRLLGKKEPTFPGPIFAYYPKNRKESKAMADQLLRGKIYPSLIQYPGGPPEGYFRFAISAAHSPRQIQRLARVMSPFVR